MKLVNQYLDPSEAASARLRLREAGVASLVDAMDPHNIQPSKSGATHIGLWVLVDDQLEDAIQILEDPAHVPQRIFSPDEMASLEVSAGRQSKPSQPLLDKALVALLFACLLALIVYTAVDFFIGL